MEQAHREMGPTMHRMSNYAITAGEHPDTVTARTYVDALLTIDEATRTEALGYYDDELVRGPEGWKISRRVFTMVLFRPNILVGG
jgi:predicted transcriptional regulator